MYARIFNDVVTIMREDYAGCLDKQGWDHPEPYREQIAELEQKDELSAQKFAEIVQDYLLDFKDKHMSFRLKTKKQGQSLSNGFEVRRYKDKLYVTKVTKEKRLHPGDAIIALDGTPITSLVKKHGRQLMETEAEREDWKNIIKGYSHCEVLDKKGNIRSLELKEYKQKKYVPTYSLDNLNHETLLLTLTDFANPDEISTLIKDNERSLSKAENLIIDIRVNYGGSDASFFELLPYLFEEEPNSDQFLSDYAMEFNCTERNCESVVHEMKEQLSKTVDVQFQQMLQRLIKKWEKNRGKGFVSFGSPNPTFPIGKKYPKNILILTDVMCGSSGDVFAYICKMSPKVTMIGRPTAGLNDYSNLTKMEWEDFEFWYPTSRLKQISKRDESFTYGIKPHIYVPWTPEHIDNDVDMEMAMDLLKK